MLLTLEGKIAHCLTCLSASSCCCKIHCLSAGRGGRFNPAPRCGWVSESVDVPCEGNILQSDRHLSVLLHAFPAIATISADLFSSCRRPRQSVTAESEHSHSSPHVVSVSPASEAREQLLNCHLAFHFLPDPSSVLVVTERRGVDDSCRRGSHLFATKYQGRRELIKCYDS